MRRAIDKTRGRGRPPPHSWTQPVAWRAWANDVVASGERGRLDRYRRRPADAPAVIGFAHQSVSGICPHLFGETPNRATGTVSLPLSDCIVTDWRRLGLRLGRRVA